jgi:hypothetical protein
MIILGLFWVSWVGFLFILKNTPELQHYLRFSDIQATKSLTFSLLFVGLSCLSLTVVTAVGLTYYLESLALILTVIGSLVSLRLSLKG